MENVELQYQELKHRICSYIDMLNSSDKEIVQLGLSLMSEDKQFIKFASGKVNLYVLLAYNDYIKKVE